MAAMVEPPFANPIFSSNSHHLQLVQKSPPHRLNFLPTRAPRNTNLTTTACSCSAENVSSGPLLPPTPLHPPEFLSQKPNLSSDRTTKDRRKVVRLAWEKLVRWSRSWRSKVKTDVLERTNKVLYYPSLYARTHICVSRSIFVYVCFATAINFLRD